MLVTCIMPTTARRRRFLAKAIDCFLQQSWPDKELFILDEADEDSGADARLELLPSDERIRYRSFRWARITLGEKRNMACQLARGEVIVHWDDDDWSAPGRIVDQVERLQGLTKGAVTGYHSMLFWDEQGGQAYKYFGAKNYALGSSLCYRKDYWQGHPFPAKNVGEDNDFVYRAAAAGELVSVDAGALLVARIHGDSTSKKAFGTTQFPPVDAWAIPREFFTAA